jgi:hypothetical protein
MSDYFYKAASDSQQYGDSLSQYSQPIPKDLQGIQFRLLQLAYDYTISTFTDKSSAGRTKDPDFVPRVTFLAVFN